MSENDSQRPQDPGNAGETQQQPRVQVESTPADSNIPYVQAYDTQTGKPLGGQQVVNKHTVVKTKTKKLPIFITALAGCACGALLVIALIMSGTLDIGGGRNAVTAGASGSSTQKITIDSEDTTLAEAVSAKALPSVVSITATSSGSQNGSLSQSADESDSSGSVGSGVVLDTEGHILTNNHVVDGYDQYVVTMDDGTTYEAEFVGNDASSDLAVIKLKDADASKLTPIEIGDSSKLNVGEWVMAIGSPFGNEQSVSTGIVSALYRSTAMSSTSGNTIYANMIQTDAAINPGNSGGALVNDNGELVGINSLIESYSGSSSGVGFAIPVNYAKDIADQIIDGKTPVHPYLGATLSSVNALNARTNKLSTDNGAYVASVVEDGPAAKAGIQEGDVITKLGDDEITSADGLIIALRSHEVGEKVEITLVRGKEEKKVTVELGSDEELQNQQQDDSATDTGNGGITDEQLRQYLEELLGQQGQGQGYGQGFYRAVLHMSKPEGLSHQRGTAPLFSLIRWGRRKTDHLKLIRAWFDRAIHPGPSAADSVRFERGIRPHGDRWYSSIRLKSSEGVPLWSNRACLVTAWTSIPKRPRARMPPHRPTPMPRRQRARPSCATSSITTPIATTCSMRLRSRTPPLTKCSLSCRKSRPPTPTW